MDSHPGEAAPIDANLAEQDAHGHAQGSSSHEMLSLQLRQEELLADKQLVQLGVVRIRRRIVTETRLVEVSVMREEMIVERLPVETISSPEGEALAGAHVEPVLAERLRALQLGETLRLPIAEEEIVIQKRPMVTRELVIDKHLVEEVRRFTDTVRREDVRLVPVDAEQPEVQDSRRVVSELPDSPRVVSELPYDIDHAFARPDEQVPTPHVPDATRTLPLRQEELQVRTQIVEAGSVEIRTGVVSERESIVVRVAHEETDVEQVAVEHRPADRPVGSGDDVFDIPVYGERVTLRKRPVVTEEITVGKRLVDDVQQVTTAVHREVARVELQGDVEVRDVDRSQPADR